MSFVDLIPDVVGAHIERFAAFLHDPVSWPGKAPRDWAVHVVADEVLLARLPATIMTRDSLLGLCTDPSTPDEVCFLAVCAWGGMRISNARLAWARRDLWLPLIRGMRSPGCPSREGLFAQFAEARVPGLGPAFFTKLMHFCAADKGCLIMDQWTSRSVNLLCGTEVVRLLRQPGAVSVSRGNQAGNYERYCLVVETLAAQFMLPAAALEEQLFAGGGLHRWRQYVRHYG
ncbi:hypothetical protein THUN1379_24640 [Paludibacterium sp. THUN1379]|uniref:8-oxoguanine DNA glycosylase OGG fold protein n=1 Tax=Paludibacterium sp. THUN1379 TaxID=3112107 RepID=UPI003087557C|nr:hypothetical protein THUN1379_24640 [Paludibacterium sp. THUN1379]